MFGALYAAEGSPPEVLAEAAYDALVLSLYVRKGF